MTVYMYAAAFYCEDCGRAICQDIARDAAKAAILKLDDKLGSTLGKKKQFLFDLEDIIQEELEDQQLDTDNYPASYPDCGESDSPHNCDACSRPLEYTLTNDGVDYVIEQVRDTLRNGRAFYCKTRGDYHDGKDYYAGSPQFAVMRDWVEDMQYYNLDREQSRVFRMIEWMERVHNTVPVAK